MIIGREFHFDAAHRLPEYPGKCNRYHGHTWKLTVEVFAEIDEKTGFVMDLAELKKLVNPVLDRFDHNFLNGFQLDNGEIIINPTCEILIEVIAGMLKEKLLIYNQTKSSSRPVCLYSLKLQEGVGGYARWMC